LEGVWVALAEVLMVALTTTLHRLVVELQTLAEAAEAVEIITEQGLLEGLV
jgi:hypothetical protein